MKKERPYGRSFFIHRAEKWVWMASIQPLGIDREEPLDLLFKQRLGGKVSVPGQLLLRGGLRLVQQAHVAAQIGNTQRGQAVLPLAKKVAGAPQLQILFRDFKPVVGGGKGLQAALRLSVALGTSTPTSTTVVDTRISASPAEKAAMTASFSLAFIFPCSKATRSVGKVSSCSVLA